MKRLFTLFLAALLCAGIVIDDAEARRFGGGRSFGRQRSGYSSPSRSSGSSPAGAPVTNNRRPFGGNWLGPAVGGFLAGGLLASLFMGRGFGGGIGLMDILLIAGIGMAMLYIFRNMRRGSPHSPQGQMQYAGYGGQLMPSQPMSPPPVYESGPRSGTATMGRLPAGFDEQAFLRLAKSTFIRLQAANDAKDLSDIRQYTTPEVFAEVSMQARERPDAPQHTEVLTLNAELLDVATEGDLVIASVQFSGLLREEAHAPAEPLNEIWHFQKPAHQPHAPWLIGGIQQNG